MSKSILVGYATRYGSTQEVAEAVTSVLRENGFQVEYQPLKDICKIDKYDAIVIGAPLYIGRWHKDARKFLSTHKNELVNRPVAFFTLGPTKQDEEDWKDVRMQLDKQFAEYSWLKPVSSELFGGRYNPAKLGFTFKLLAALPASPLHNMPASDLRDWTKIREWAQRLAGQI